MATNICKTRNQHNMHMITDSLSLLFSLDLIFHSACSVQKFNNFLSLCLHTTSLSHPPHLSVPTFHPPMTHLLTPLLCVRPHIPSIPCQPSSPSLLHFHQSPINLPSSLLCFISTPIHRPTQPSLPQSKHLILQVPDTVPVGELLMGSAALGQHAALKATHVEEQVRVVLTVDGHEAAVPLDGGHGARQAVLDVPEHRATPVWIEICMVSKTLWLSEPCALRFVWSERLVFVSALSIDICRGQEGSMFVGALCIVICMVRKTHVCQCPQLRHL